MPHPSEICLQVDAARQQLRCGDAVQTLRGQLVVAFLHILVVNAHADAHSAASVEGMQYALQRLGLARVLKPVEWARIVESLKRALDALAPNGELAARLQHWPRGKTVGPWWFRTEKLVVVTSTDATATLPQPVLPPAPDRTFDAPLSMTVSADGARALALTQRLKAAMEAHWKALPAFAAELLADSPAWAGESMALRGLRRLRHAELMHAQGEPDAALALLDRMTSEIRQPELSALLAPHATVMRWRVAYAGDPVGRYAGIGKDLHNALAARTRVGASWLDATAMAEHFHLLMLCERRGLEQSPPKDCSDVGAGHRLSTMLHSGYSALLLFFLVRNYERAQHVCANLAYAHQKLAQTFPTEHIELALGWHTLSFSMHTTFGGAESSAWEYIFLGELWLDSCEARRLWKDMNRHAVWQDQSPESAGFYESACRIADQLADPRQQAYTRLNQYRYARDFGRAAAQEAAAERLAEILEHRNDLVKLLLSEGYELPARFRRIGAVIAF